MKFKIFIVLVSISLFLCQSVTNEEYIYAYSNNPFTHTEDETLYLTNNFATYYFNSLNFNYGLNEIGSCGYIALQMLLSYYDTYWDDTIILDSYDKNEIVSSLNLADITESPGTVSEASFLAGHSSYTNQEYYRLILDEYMSFFHFYLINIATTHFHYCDFSEDVEYPCASYSDEIFDVLSYYLYECRGFAQAEVEIKYEDDPEKVRDFVIDNVLNGTPVWVSASSSLPDVKNHALVVYDYNESDDELLAHMGNRVMYEYNEHMILNTTYYDQLNAAIALDFDTNHVCSNNYQYGDEELESYCSCYFGIHPEHEHTYESFRNINKLSHYGYCHCGHQQSQAHIVSDSAAALGNARCLLCGGEVEIGFSTFGISIINNPLTTRNILSSGEYYTLPNGVIVIPDNLVEEIK